MLDDFILKGLRQSRAVMTSALQRKAMFLATAKKGQFSYGVSELFYFINVYMDKDDLINDQEHQ